jgi:hypothetical protein
VGSIPTGATYQRECKMELKELRTKISELSPVSTGHEFWRLVRNDFRNWIMSFDPSNGNFRNSQAVGMTMETGQAEYILEKELPFINDRIKSVINKREDGSHEGNMSHHAYHLSKFEQHSGKDVSSLSSVFEYGAGYGNTCEIIHKLGFNGDYYIRDFPEFCLLQQFYLEENNIDTSKIVWNPSETPEVDLFIAEWSLSETPHEERKNCGYEKCATNYLLAFQHSFKEVENYFDTVQNMDYFDSFKNNNSSCMIWYYERIEHMPNSSYLIGYS